MIQFLQESTITNQTFSTSQSDFELPKTKIRKATTIFAV